MMTMSVSPPPRRVKIKLAWSMSSFLPPLTYWLTWHTSEFAVGRLLRRRMTPQSVLVCVYCWWSNSLKPQREMCLDVLEHWLTGKESCGGVYTVYMYIFASCLCLKRTSITFVRIGVYAEQQRNCFDGEYIEFRKVRYWSDRDGRGICLQREMDWDVWCEFYNFTYIL